MAQGIVRVTPRLGVRNSGSLQITVVDIVNTYHIKVGDTLTFDDPGFTLRVGDTVDCTVLSSTTCRVNRVIP